MQPPRPAPSLRRPTPARAALALTLAAAGCSDDGTTTDTSSSSSSAASTTAEPTTATEPTTTAAPDTTTTESTTTAAPDTTTGNTTGPIATTTGETTGPIATDTTDTTSSSGSSSTGDTGGDTLVKVQLLAFNDLHGNLEPPAGSSGKITLPDDSKVDVGGVAFLATHVAALRADNPNTIVVSAGDLIGASPLTSALFHDEPTIEAMNQLGLAYTAVGNHEFDDGASELLRMQTGGCHPIDGCSDGSPFPGADFKFLAANVLVSEQPIKTLFPSYAIHELDGVRIAFIGMTLESTPDIVTPIGNAGLTFLDEATRANALVPELQAVGVEAIVVLIHEGGYQSGYYDQCEGVSGPIVAITEQLDPAIDVVISGHTHSAYNCVIADKLVTSAASFGRLLTDIDLEISTLTGDITTATASNVLVTRDLADPDLAAFVATYKDLAAPLANQQIGTITATLDRYPPMMKPGLSTMGAVIADSQLAATAPVMLGAAQIALMNQGGVRADLLFPKAPGELVDGVVSYGEAFAVQPFGNSLVVMTLTGAQIDAVLEQQFSQNFSNVLQVSQGFSFAYSASAPLGARVDPASIKLDGVALEPDQSYRVTVNSYLAAGGDGFSVLLDGTDRLGGPNDLDAFADYLAEQSPVAPPALDRITELP